MPPRSRIGSGRGSPDRSPARDQHRIAEPDRDAQAPRGARARGLRRRTDVRPERQRRALEQRSAEDRRGQGEAGDRGRVRARHRGRRPHARRARRDREAEPPARRRDEPEALPGHVPRLPAEADVLKALEAAVKGKERLVHSGRELYAWHPDGIGRSKLAALLGGPRLGVAATSRNWTTVTALLELARE